MSAVRVVQPPELVIGSLVLAIYGEPGARVDDGLVSSDETQPYLPLSTVAESHPVDDETWEITFRDGLSLRLGPTSELEVIAP